MKEILKVADAKTITSVGGIILALVLAFFIYDLSGRKITDLAEAVNAFKEEDIDAKKSLADALLKNATAVEGNTKVMQQFQVVLTAQKLR